MPRTEEQRASHALAARRWRASNSDKIRAQRRAHYAANRDRHLETVARYRARHRDQYLAQQKRYRAANPDVHREHGYLRRYGKTIAEYDAVIALQNGGCALCSRPPKNRRLAWDHCHDTGRVRGLLCVGCNVHLGGLGDNEAGLLRALEYVRGAQ